MFWLLLRDRVFASTLVQQGDIRKVKEAWETSDNDGAAIGNLLFIIYLFICHLRNIDHLSSRQLHFAFFVVEHICNIRDDIMASLDLMTRLNISAIKWRILAITYRIICLVTYCYHDANTQ